MFKRTIIIAVLAAPLFATSAHAQKWDAPLFFSPRPMDDIGIYYTRTSQGDFNGLRGIWRQSGNLNLGVHLGVGDLEEPGESILVGAEFYQPLRGLSGQTGLIMSWSLGAGATFGDVNGVDYIDFSVPLGVSVGMNLGTGSVALLPYIHPRVSFDLVAVGEGPAEETESDIGFAADIGVDLNLGERLVLRTAYTFDIIDNDLGDRGAFGVGLALRIPRKVSVR